MYPFGKEPIGNTWKKGRWIQKPNLDGEWTFKADVSDYYGQLSKAAQHRPVASRAALRCLTKLLQILLRVKWKHLFQLQLELGA